MRFGFPMAQAMVMVLLAGFGLCSVSGAFADERAPGALVIGGQTSGGTAAPYTRSSQKNEPASNWFLFWHGTAAAGLKAKLMAKYGTPSVTITTDARAEGTIRLSAGDGNAYPDLPAGYKVGPFGCGPCIGLMIAGPQPKTGQRCVWAYHFSAGDNPQATLQKAGPFPPGSSVVIIGGEDTEPGSMATLASVESYLTSNPKLKVLGYYNTPAMHVDRDGKFYIPSFALGTRSDKKLNQVYKKGQKPSA